MKSMSNCLRVPSLLFGLVSLGVWLSQHAAAGQAASARDVTFTEDVVPILQRSCQSCHRPAGIAPMSLMTYDEARPWARAIKLRTSRREMPPWFIERNIGSQRFKDDISLSDDEIAKIASWVDDGAPRGNPSDLPATRQFADAGPRGPERLSTSRCCTAISTSPRARTTYGSTRTE